MKTKHFVSESNEHMAGGPSPTDSSKVDIDERLKRVLQKS